MRFLTKSHKRMKQYTYKKGDMTLDFTLNVDNKNQVSDFLDLLNEAGAELNKEINNKE